jgi:hypothetical protein
VKLPLYVRTAQAEHRAKFVECGASIGPDKPHGDRLGSINPAGSATLR